MSQNTAKSASQKKGLCSELICLAFYQNAGYRLLAHRYKIYDVEVDLLLQRDQELLMVEVKSVGNIEYLANRLTQRQKKRLQRAYYALLHEYPSFEVAFHLSCVHQGKVLFFDTAL